MPWNTIIGCAVIGLALTAIVILVLWSRSIIERIDRASGRSAREVLRELQRDDQAR